MMDGSEPVSFCCCCILGKNWLRFEAVIRRSVPAGMRCKAGWCMLVIAGESGTRALCLSGQDQCTASEKSSIAYTTLVLGLWQGLVWWLSCQRVYGNIEMLHVAWIASARCVCLNWSLMILIWCYFIDSGFCVVLSKWLGERRCSLDFSLSFLSW